MTYQSIIGNVLEAASHIYMKMLHFVMNSRGGQKKKYPYTAIAAVIAMRLKEDEEPEAIEPDDKNEDKPATYRCAYVLISNRVDASDQVLQVYAKRWRIEVFFRRAKQNLGLANCHFTTEEYYNAYSELLFACATLLGYTHWGMNKEKRVMAMAAPTAKWSVASSILVVSSAPKPTRGFRRSLLRLAQKRRNLQD